MNSLCEQVSLLAYPEDGGSIILRQVGSGVQIYAALFTKKHVCKLQGRKTIRKTKCPSMMLAVLIPYSCLVAKTASSFLLTE
jgi:hypothetical protein